MEENLSNLETYEEYLESLVTLKDIYYLENIELCRQIAGNGMRSVGETMSRKEFERKKQAVLDLKAEVFKPHMMFSFESLADDSFLEALEKRERANRIGDLSTIIFVRHRWENGIEVSGYIDFEASLRKAIGKEYGAVDWLAVFKGTKKLRPKPTDLGYFNWKNGEVFVNDSPNYLTISQPDSMLQFMNKYDRMVINPTPFEEELGPSTKRFFYSTELYEHAVIYDHVVRKRF